MSINVHIDGERFGIQKFVFNDGSVQANISGDIPEKADSAIIYANLQSPEDQISMFLIKNALDIQYPGIEVILDMEFCPYGRQDKSFGKGQPNSMKTWASLINSQGFKLVKVSDPHSMAVGFINNVSETSVVDILKGSTYMQEVLSKKGIILVSPDAGANKKSHDICKEFSIETLVRADKARNVLTGDIVETIVFGDVSGRECVIVDDICDGGMTFIKLAEKLREKGASKVTLFVTHGLFTKGLGVFEGLIDEVITTKSWELHGDITDGYTGSFKQI